MSDHPVNPIDFGDLFVRFYATLVGLSFGLGAVILTGGRQRFSTPAFTSPREFVQWVPWLPPYACWGLAFLVYGILLIVSLGRPWAIHVLRLGIVVFLFLAMAFLFSVFKSPVASATGVVVYTAVAILFGIMQDHLRLHGWRH